MDDIRRPFFSVVMPAYNAAEFIGEAVESVLAQSFDDWELVIVDDCSADDTCDIVSRYVTFQDRIRLLRRTHNSGSAYTPRKEAILGSLGFHIVPLDADDTLDPDFLENMHARIMSTGADAVYCRLVRGEKVLPRDGFDTSAIYVGKDLLHYTIGGWVIAPNGSVRRELYLRAFERYGSDMTEMNADELLSRRLMIEAGKIAFCDARYNYRINPGSVSRRMDISRFDILKTDIALCDLIRDCFSDDSEELSLANVQLFDDTVGLLSIWGSYHDTLQRHDDVIASIIGQARRSIDWKRVNGRVNPVKAMLLRMGVFPLRFLYLVYGSVKRRKQL